LGISRRAARQRAPVEHCSRSKVSAGEINASDDRRKRCKRGERIRFHSRRSYRDWRLRISLLVSVNSSFFQRWQYSDLIASLLSLIYALFRRASVYSSSLSALDSRWQYQRGIRTHPEVPDRFAAQTGRHPQW
jgi:hypothetical protein